ncbi:FxSxx-COOH system tetratricopeptide repeat protein [Streptomyces hoynatensis]|uniref:Tetratricopeptide repeat protein n=1 Tax=Streptomyces hoynatensis TaxID=1141874 RepID=A0A3A9Z5K5_9ACTN|nr:FxSxx-COOH system tetratricopeptide repeat protein [Streptomyces hoynatensis]RKN43124.1 hypothetical protein D7294_11590 [Streptomyces hoynatensis]
MNTAISVEPPDDPALTGRGPLAWRQSAASGERAVAVDANSGIVSTGPGATIYARPAVRLPPAHTVAGPPGPHNHNLPRPPNAQFVGRAEELSRVRELLASGTGVITQTVVGLGGVGKTSLALQYAHRHRADYTTVWWITADQPDAITAGLASLTSRLLPDLASSATIPVLAEWAITWFQTHPGWLVVFDNAEDPRALEPVISQLDTGHHLVTSRRTTGWHRLGTPLRLDMLMPQDATELLLRIAGRGAGEREAAARVAAELGYLPLAVEQAGAYCHHHGIGCAAFLERLRRYPARMFAAAYPGSTDRRTIARTWRVTLSTIAAADPLAADLLRVLAWLAPDRVPRDLLAAVGDDPLAVDDALALLGGYSMITLGSAHLRVHRLVQAVARTPDPADPMRAEAEILAARGRAARLLRGALPRGLSIDVPSWPRWRALLPHIEAYAELMPAEQDTSDVAFLLHAGSLFQLDQGHLAQAAAWGERALAARERVLGADHPATLSTRNHLGNVYRAAGDLGRVIPLYERTLADRERVLGEDHPDTLASRNYLANAYRDAGRVGEALPLYARTLADRERVLGREHIESLISRNNLASGYRDAGDLARAVPLFESTREDAERVLGAAHPRTLLFGNNLGTAYEAAGDLRRALPLYERTLAGRERVLGADHPDTLTTRNNLASALQESGDLPRALALFERTVADARRVLGAEHPRTLLARGNLAEAVFEAGGAGEAERALGMLREVLADSVRTLGADHPDTLLARNNLAGALLETGAAGEAAARFESLVADSGRTLGARHPDTLLARSNLGAAYRVAGRAAEAVASLEETLADCERTLSPGHPHGLAVRHNLGLAHLAAGEPAAALARLAPALAEAERLLGAEHPRVAVHRFGLSLAQAAAGDVRSAIGQAERALAVRRRLLGRDHPRTHALGRTLGRLRRRLVTLPYEPGAGRPVAFGGTGAYPAGGPGAPPGGTTAERPGAQPQDNPGARPGESPGANPGARPDADPGAS